MEDFQVTVTDPERAKEWRRVLGTATVPVTTPISTTANLPGKPCAWVFFLDVKMLSKEQLVKLVMHLAEKFKVETSEVAETMHRDPAHAVPILAEHCTVVVRNLQKWF